VKFMQPVISEQEELELAKKLSLGIDSDSLAQLNNKQYADAIDPRFGISNRNLIALKLLSYYSRPEITEKPSEAERLLVQDFLKSVKGDMEFNEALTSIAQMSLSGTGISGIVVGDMKVYTYKTRNFRVFTDSFGKLNRNYARAREGLDLIEEDKISLAEYSSVNDMAKLQPIIEDFARKGFFDGDQILEELRNNANESLAILEKMESDFKDSQVAEPGKIAFDHSEKKSSVLGIFTVFRMVNCKIHN
jgi:hypothetical protein